MQTDVNMSAPGKVFVGKYLVDTYRIIGTELCSTAVWEPELGGYLHGSHATITMIHEENDHKLLGEVTSRRLSDSLEALHGEERRIQVNAHYARLTRFASRLVKLAEKRRKECS